MNTAILAILFLATVFAQYFAGPQLRWLEARAGQLAQRKVAIVIGAALLSIVARLLLLPLAPVPIPSVHDEFSYLLAGDTFAHGRLANPPHPMWVFFDTFHVLQHPTYASIYAPAQGAVLALGQLLGHPWIGVLLSAALMCSAVTWALQGWLPARWALLGSLLTILRVDLMSYWVDSYWGGAIAAMGGALVIGAIPRLARKPTVLNSLLMGVGAALLANSRPAEGALFCLGVALILAAHLFSHRDDQLRKRWLSAFLPAATVLLLTTAFMGYYNWRVTGDAVLFPHAAYQRLYWGSGPIFVWQKSGLLPTYDNPQFTQFFTAWHQSEVIQRSWPRVLLTRSQIAWSFFLGPAYSIALLALPWTLGDRKIRSLIALSVWCLLWVPLVRWFSPHYIAGLTACFYLLLVQAIRHLRQWKYMRWPIGIFCSRIIMVLAIARLVTLRTEPVSPPFRGWNLSRAQIAANLERLSNKSLVLVRYDPDHDVHDEWVYNAADIDDARVIWAREIPGRDLKPLLSYFHDRQIWVVDADAKPIRIQPYP
jgi:hypothetical protein